MDSASSSVNASLDVRFPLRSRRWQLRRSVLEFGTTPQLMGIVNVTPDSFSDGGRWFETVLAVEHGLRLAEEGAAILDVGGESTRPYSQPVSEAEELRRVISVVQQLAEQTDVPISIDTSKAKVAEEALAAGAQIINDVTGLEGDADMIPVAIESDAAVCAMHMQGTPQTMQDNPSYDNVVSDIVNYLQQRQQKLVAAGVAQERICLDPGIGFGKSHQHNLTLVAHCGQFHSLGCPILVGHSRKGFLAKIIGNAKADRTFATVGAAMVMAQQGIQVIRVHDVLATKQTLAAFVACGGVDGCVGTLE